MTTACTQWKLNIDNMISTGIMAANVCCENSSLLTALKKIEAIILHDQCDAELRAKYLEATFYVRNSSGNLRDFNSGEKFLNEKTVAFLEAMGWTRTA